MAYPPQEQELRQAAFFWLPGSDFDDALKAATTYHEDQPPFEDKVLGKPTTVPTLQSHVDLLIDAKDKIEEINVATRASLLEDHRQKLMEPFLKKDVSKDVARKIADAIIAGVLKSKPPEE